MKIRFQPYGVGFPDSHTEFDDARTDLFTHFVFLATQHDPHEDEFMEIMDSARVSAQLTMESPSAEDRHGNEFGIRMVFE